MSMTGRAPPEASYRVETQRKTLIKTSACPCRASHVTGAAEQAVACIPDDAYQHPLVVAERAPVWFKVSDPQESEDWAPFGLAVRV